MLVITLGGARQEGQERKAILSEAEVSLGCTRHCLQTTNQPKPLFIVYMDEILRGKGSKQNTSKPRNIKLPAPTNNKGICLWRFTYK